MRGGAAPQRHKEHQASLALLQRGLLPCRRRTVYKRQAEQDGGDLEVGQIELLQDDLQQGRGRRMLGVQSGFG